jgi:hypothetical protein
MSGNLSLQFLFTVLDENQCEKNGHHCKNEKQRQTDFDLEID